LLRLDATRVSVRRTSLPRMYTSMLFLMAMTIFSLVQEATAQSPTCTSASDLIPDSSACQRYTNCSREASYRRSRLFPVQVDECPYPQLFDSLERRCKPFSEAKCSPGTVASKDPCDYLDNQCGGAHCEPCSSRLPSCVGLQDGVHPHPTRQAYLYFIECNQERTVGVRYCRPNQSPNGPGSSSIIETTCTRQWRLPTSSEEPNHVCEGKEAKLYAVFHRPSVYYNCPTTQVYVCPDNRRFDATTQQCG
jgi:hypothetical protein